MDASAPGAHDVLHPEWLKVLIYTQGKGPNGSQLLTH